MKHSLPTLDVPSPLPLGRSRNVLPLAVILTLMVFLASLAMLVQGGLHGLAARWSQQTEGALTVELAPAPDLDDTARNARLQKITATLNGTPGITVVTPLPAAEAEALLQPWLGTEAGTPALPLPQLIDVNLAEGTSLGAAELTQILKEAGATDFMVDDRSAWLQGMARFTHLLQAMALLIALLATAAMVAAVMFACRAGLVMHHEIVELLHIMGASDDLIALEFRRFIRRVVVPAALGGFGISLLAVAGVLALAHWHDLALGAGFSLTAGNALYLALSVLAMPVLAAVIAQYAAQHSVLAALRTMP